MEQTKVFTLLNMTAEPGARVHGFLKLGEGEFSVPAAILHGKYPGKTVLITAGVHAGEYVGIQTAVELSGELKLEKLHGTLVIIKAVCREELEHRAGSLGIEDGCNLNWEFPGKRDGSRTQRLAYAIEKELHAAADYYIDLHSGDDYEELTPYVYYAGMGEEAVVQKSRRMAQQVDVPYMVKSNVSSGGSYNYAAFCGIPSILIERGGMGVWNREEVQSNKRDIKNVLKYLGIYRGDRDNRNHYPLEVQNLIYQSADEFGFWYPTRKPGTIFKAGEILGTVRDYEGKVLETCYAEFDGVILYQTGSLQVVKEGPMIAYGQIVRTGDDRKERITNYWTKRSMSFLEQRRKELHSALAGRWLAEIEPYLPENKSLKILDVGCGAGFFSILLAKKGHQVTGIDLTPDMIANSKELAKEEGVSCEFLVMDAEQVAFPDEAFDLVISRNLTWTLPRAQEAYREWNRVLKKGGILLNFDGNYGADNPADAGELPENHAHMQLGDEMMQEYEAIKRLLPISNYARPAWDLETLGRLKMEQFVVDLGVSRRVYIEKDEFYNPTPLFLVSGRKCD